LPFIAFFFLRLQLFGMGIINSTAKLSGR